MTEIDKKIIEAKKEIFSSLKKIEKKIKTEYIIPRGLTWGHLANLNKVKDDLKEIEEFLKN